MKDIFLKGAYSGISIEYEDYMLKDNLIQITCIEDEESGVICYDAQVDIDELIEILQKIKEKKNEIKH